MSSHFSAKSICRLGEKIELHPDIHQPTDVFDWKGYRELLQRAKWNREESSHWHSIIQTLPEPMKYRGQESERFHTLAEQFRTLMQEYRSRLPIHVFAQCPYCNTDILQPVDVFSLLGFHSDYQATETFHGHESWHKITPFNQICPHALCATISVSLHGCTPDDLALWLHGTKLRMLHNSPRVMVWPLLARHTSAVMHSLPIGRLDDEVPTHHYTMYITAYFVHEDSNLRTSKLWVPNEFGQPATEAVWYDMDLLKWLQADRLFWMDPENMFRIVQGPPASFPYFGIAPGWYDILPKGLINGPHPYANSWNGHAPLPNESYTRSVDLDA